MTQQLDVAKLMDDARLGRSQLLTLGLCFLAMAVDGFDMLILPNTAPLVLHALHIEPARFGMLISISLLGMVLSGFGGGLLADKLGRRILILSGLTLFGCMTIAKAYATTYNSLFVLQALTGIGIGAVFTNVLALSAEYAPARNRRFLVTCVSSAYPLGGVLASYAAASLGPSLGWAPIFMLGGAAALILAGLCLAFLPPSVRQLVLRGKPAADVDRIMVKIAPIPVGDVRWVSSEEKIPKAPFRNVFSGGRAAMTFILAIAVGATLMSNYFVIGWSPLLFNMAGMSPSRSAMVGSMFPMGSMIGAWIWGRLLDHFSPPAVLCFASLLGAVCYGLIGHTLFSFPLLMATVIVGGLGMGVQSGYNGFITSLYPTSVRGTALGLIIGTGRLAAIFGPLLGGILVAAKWNINHLYFVPAGLLAVGSLCMIVIHMVPSSRISIAAIRRSPPLFMKHDDEFVVEIEQVGSLRNTVMDEGERAAPARERRN
jgi:AAHS family 4-hydroxybenzoate transporter-like MFS transporter